MSASAISAEEPDTTFVLQEVEVVSQGPVRNSSIDKLGNSRVSIQGLQRGMRSLGTADAIKALSMLPEYSSISDYSSGISIGGSNYSQVSYTYAGAPVFFPYHFGGIFSTFNTYHLSSLNAYSSAVPLLEPERIGGAVVAQPVNSPTDAMHGGADVGVLASSISLTSPSGFSASARLSYINALYGSMLSTSDCDIKYDLGDINLSYEKSLTNRDKIRIDGIYNRDRLYYDDVNYGMNTHLDWTNAAVSANWSHGDNIRATAYYSSFEDKLSMNMSQFGIEAPAGISQCGAYGSYRKGDLETGIRYEYTKTRPQTPTYFGTIDEFTPLKQTYTSHYSRIYGSWRRVLSPTSDLQIAAAISTDYSHVIPTGFVRLTHQRGDHTYALTAEATSQYLHQVGFSEIGLASNFWIQSVKHIKPQQAYGVTFNWHSDWQESIFTTNFNAYAKRIINDWEFSGSLLDLLSNDYNPLNYIIAGNGYNYGASAMLAVNTHPVLGSVSLSTGLCPRRKDDGKWYHSTYEPLYSIKCNTAWIANDRITVHAAFMASAGRTYTPVTSLYFFSGNLIAEYGEHNSARLPAYHRLDLSMTYNLPAIKSHSRKFSQFVNVSIQNVYNHRNVELQYYRYKPSTHEIYLSQTGSLYRFLPSVSYTVML